MKKFVKTESELRKIISESKETKFTGIKTLSIKIKDGKDSVIESDTNLDEDEIAELVRSINE